VALREKVQGGKVNGSPSGDGVFEQSSPAAKADQIYSTFEKPAKMLSFRSTHAAFSANYPSFPLPSDVVPAASTAASYLLGPEFGEPLGGGDEEKWREKGKQVSVKMGQRVQKWNHAFSLSFSPAFI